jgi:hypothetical protein
MSAYFFRLLPLITQLAQIADSPEVDVPKGDTGLYLLCREFCKRLESRNPGIHQAAGYFGEVKSYY